LLTATLNIYDTTNGCETSPTFHVNIAAMHSSLTSATTKANGAPYRWRRSRRESNMSSNSLRALSATNVDRTCKFA
jgi:hypothetical protein